MVEGRSGRGAKARKVSKEAVREGRGEKSDRESQKERKRGQPRERKGTRVRSAMGMEG